MSYSICLSAVFYLSSICLLSVFSSAVFYLSYFCLTFVYRQSVYLTKNLSVVLSDDDDDVVRRLLEHAVRRAQDEPRRDEGSAAEGPSPVRPDDAHVEPVRVRDRDGPVDDPVVGHATFAKVLGKFPFYSITLLISV